MISKSALRSSVRSSAVFQRFPLHQARDVTVTHLSDLLAAHHRGAAHLSDATTQAAVTAGADPILYTAYRDVQPPRPTWPGDVGGGGVYGDLVVYERGPLPGGHHVRSLGHWNAPTQIEIFQVLVGTVLIVWADPARPGNSRPRLQHQICRPGALASIPMGAWHLTYALAGPAAVFNIYTDLHIAPAIGTDLHIVAERAAGLGSSRQAALDPRLKYGRDRPPVALDLATTTGEPHPVPIAHAATAWGPSHSVAEPVWARRIVGDDLAAWHAGATPADLTRLHHAAPRS